MMTCHIHLPVETKIDFPLYIYFFCDCLFTSSNFIFSIHMEQCLSNDDLIRQLCSQYDSSVGEYKNGETGIHVV